MATPTRESMLSLLRNDWWYSSYYTGRASGKITEAIDYCGNGEWNEAVWALCYASEWLVDSLYRLARSYGDYPYTPIPYFLEHFTTDAAAEITWKAICEAWAKNDFEGKEWTIACIDRMRQLMWDKPYYMLWAAKPTAPR